MVLIDRKFDEEQLLLETFFTKIHIERDICKQLHFEGLKPPINKIYRWGAGGLICCLGHSFSIISRTQTFAGSMFFFFSSFA